MNIEYKPRIILLSHMWDLCGTHYSSMFQSLFCPLSILRRIPISSPPPQPQSLPVPGGLVRLHTTLVCLLASHSVTSSVGELKAVSSQTLLLI